jgi:tetratricopeptide (TPR) repeat protein
MEFFKKDTFIHRSIVFINILIPLLGGGYDSWSAGITLFLTSLLILIKPSESYLEKSFNIGLFILSVFALCNFLPIQLFKLQPWRVSCTRDYGIPLSPLLSPQPALSLEGVIFLFWGILWVYYNLSTPFSLTERYSIPRIWSTGYLISATVCFIFYFLHLHPSIWHSPKNFGFFANRNQTGNYFAIGGLITLACAYEDFRAGRLMASMFRLGGTIFLLCTLILVGSKMGPILFFAGGFIWFLWLGSVSRNGKQICIGASVFFCLVTILFLFGGRTVERILCINPVDETYIHNLRWTIHKDTLELILHHPFFGIGLENFQFIFPFYQKASITQSLAHHPESDILWAAAELGIPAVLCILLLVGFKLRKALPFVREKSYSIRIMAFVCVALFVAHGFADVSCHRVGTFLAAVLLLKLSLPLSEDRQAKKQIGSFFRMACLPFLIVGLLWTTENWLPSKPPTRRNMELIRDETDLSFKKNDLTKVIQLSTSALYWTPLEWSFYYDRAFAEGYLGKTDQAIEDFRRARFLMPNLFSIRMEEGKFWLKKNPEATLVAWSEGLHLAENQESCFENMLSISKSEPIVRKELEKIAREKPSLLLIFINHAKPEELESDLQWILSKNPEFKDFTNAQVEKLISIWMGTGNKEKITSILENNEVLLKTGWPWVAQNYAERKDFEKAYQLVTHYSSAPALHETPSVKTYDEMKMDFILNPEDVVRGMTLLEKQLRSQRTDEALETIHKLKNLNNSPSSIYFREAEIWAQKEEWEKAWNNWSEYREKINKKGR